MGSDSNNDVGHWHPLSVDTRIKSGYDEGEQLPYLDQIPSFQRTLESSSASQPAATSDLDPSLRWDDEDETKTHPHNDIAGLDQAVHAAARQPRTVKTATRHTSTARMDTRIKSGYDEGEKLPYLHQIPSFQRTLESSSASQPAAASDLDPSLRWDDEDETKIHPSIIIAGIDLGMTKEDTFVALPTRHCRA